jgi:hypothetical protein
VFDYFFNELGKDLPDEIWRISTIARISGYVNQPRSFRLDEPLIGRIEDGKKVDLITALMTLATINQINIKQNSFRAMHELFVRISGDKAMKAELCANRGLIKSIFRLLIENWEFPIKGFGNFIEDIFNKYLVCIKDSVTHGGKSVYEDILDAIEGMEFKSTKRRYASLKVLLNYLTIEQIMAKSPGILGELLNYPDTVAETTVVMLFGCMLDKRFEELSKLSPKDKEGNVKKWVEFWYPTYEKTLETCDLKHAKIIVEYFHPHIYSKCKDCLPLVLGKMGQVSNKTKNH